MHQRKRLRPIDSRQNKNLVFYNGEFHDVSDDQIKACDDKQDYSKVTGIVANFQEAKGGVDVPNDNIIHTGQLEDTKATDELPVMIEKLYQLLDNIGTDATLLQTYTDSQQREALRSNVFSFLSGMELNHASVIYETEAEQGTRLNEDKAVCHALFHALKDPNKENVKNLTDATPQFIQRNSWAKGVLAAITGVLTVLAGVALIALPVPFTGWVGVGVAGAGALLTGYGIHKISKANSGRRLEKASEILATKANTNTM